MNITRLQIKKLNGKYDFNIDLNRRCTIIVGANGVGKTTILKIIECISIYDFYGLLKFSFEEIIFDYSISDYKTGSASVKYSDLMPPIDSIIDKTIDICKSMETITDSECEFISTKTKVYLQDLLDNRKLNRIVYEMINQNYDEAQFVISLTDKDLALTRYLALAMEYFIGRELFPVIFRESRLFNKIQNELKRDPSHNVLFYKDYILERKSTYYLSMVKKIEIKEKYNKGSFLNSAYMDWLHSYKEEISFFKHIDDIKKENEQLPPNWRFFSYYSSVGKAFHGKSDLLYAYTTALRMVDDFGFERWIDNDDIDNQSNNQEYEINGWYHNKERRHSFGVRSINNRQDVDQIEIESLMNNNTISINNLINRFYYDDGFQIQINKEYCNYLADVLEEKISSENVDEMNKYVKNKLANKEFIKYCSDFFNPLISPSIGHWVNMVQLPESLNNNLEKYYEKIQEEYFHIMFAEKVKEDLENEKNINVKILSIKNLLEKYLQDKIVEITPRGLKLYDRDDKECETPLDVSEISSGEVKIIVLLFAATFSKSLKIFIDEPELSLSIAWQEEILQDIIDNGECKIVVATHSPYMAGNELLRNSVSYVPG